MDRTAEMIGPEQRGSRRSAARMRPGFSLIDLLVSMMVMGLLIAVLMPAVGHVRDMARRTECRSNMRQQGLALQMYAYDHDGRLPQTVFSSESNSGDFASATDQTVMLRVNANDPRYIGAGHTSDWSRWDGMGILYAQEYLTAPQVFYCPANRGLFDYPEFASRFAGAPGEITGNYQYRIVGNREYLSDLDPHFTVISNATRSVAEYSHRVGNNMLKADMSVSWFADVGGRLIASIANSAGSGRGEDNGVDFAWKLMDSDGRYTDRAAGRGNTLEDGDSTAPQGGRAQYKKE